MANENFEPCQKRNISAQNSIDVFHRFNQPERTNQHRMRFARLVLTNKVREKSQTLKKPKNEFIQPKTKT